ncbi:hypothetical protein BCR32DRAFT_278693 [Anaeromyces robustus]|uniref:ABC transmembrane type-1 domain-containing protein n=1 Tax=Anaeromyces robustus TaxID=1754192 RepID=A0A1Y1XAE0_9FUNG|nr:hypothetical protein BCR32DRAFT_278693 [Anaeromyces robustus]|eukprot:ORX82708.1 hypothetical protein BCR32DRAFT_278693 [Anaeromyces robustus]
MFWTDKIMFKCIINYSISNTIICHEIINVDDEFRKIIKQRKISRKESMISDNINILYNITYGNPEIVYLAIFYNILSDLINIVLFIFTVIIVLTIFDSFDGSDNPLNKTEIWIISICLFLYMSIMYYFQIVSYNHNYFEAYQISSIGRIELAQHILRLPIGTIYLEDAGEMVNILMNEFTIIETSITHWIPQFCASLIVVIFTFIGLLFIN